MTEQEYTVTCKKCGNVLYYIEFECTQTLVDCPDCEAQYICCENTIMEDVTK